MLEVFFFAGPCSHCDFQLSLFQNVILMATQSGLLVGAFNLFLWNILLSTLFVARLWHNIGAPRFHLCAGMHIEKCGSLRQIHASPWTGLTSAEQRPIYPGDRSLYEPLVLPGVYLSVLCTV